MMLSRADIQIDATCFRLARLCAVMDDAGVVDYRRWSRAQIDGARTEVMCTVGRERFGEGVRRHGEWLASLTYEQYLQTGDWAVVRYFALRLAQYLCAECAAGRQLHVHHRTYERLGAERLADVVVLCEACHGRTHDSARANHDTDRRGEGLMATTVVAPERSRAQRLQALELANSVRVRRSRLKREIKREGRPVRDVLLDPPMEAQSMKVFDLLLSVPKWGRVKASKTLKMAAVSPSKTVGGLSERQRAELAGMVRNGS